MALSRVSEYAISLPFRIDDFGGVANTSNQINIWADRARSAIGTALAERIMRPDFGTEIPATSFDSVSNMQNLIEPEINKAFQTWLPLLELNSVTVSYDEPSNYITAEVLYTLPNREQTSVSIGVAVLNGNSPIQENLL